MRDKRTELEESAAKEAILIKAGRFTRLAGFKASAARADGGQSGARENDSRQAGLRKSPRGTGGGIKVGSRRAAL